MTFDRRRDMHAVAGPLPNMRCNSKHGAWEDGGRREMLLRLLALVYFYNRHRQMPPSSNSGRSVAQ